MVPVCPWARPFTKIRLEGSMAVTLLQSETSERIDYPQHLNATCISKYDLQ